MTKGAYPYLQGDESNSRAKGTPCLPSPPLARGRNLLRTDRVLYFVPFVLACEMGPGGGTGGDEFIKKWTGDGCRRAGGEGEGEGGLRRMMVHGCVPGNALLSACFSMVRLSSANGCISLL